MNRSREIIRVSIMGIAANVVLVIFKAIVGFASNSTAVILDAVNNLSDALSSVITIVGTRLAKKKADKQHPFGHGRVEYITSFIIAILVLAAGVTSLKESVEKIIDPPATNFSRLSLAVIGAAIAAKLLIGALFIAVCAVVWFLLTQKNKGNGGCSGHCAPFHFLTGDASFCYNSCG